MAERYLTILEVSQKQAYIFQSNELRNNILNSAVIAWVMSESYMEKVAGDAADFSEEKNLVYSGGGHTVLEFGTRDKAVRFTKLFTSTVRREYPGIEVFAATREYDPGMPPGENLAELTRQLERKKSVRRSAFHQGSFGIERINTNTLKPMRKGETLESPARAEMPETERKVEKMLSVPGFQNVFRFADLGGSKEQSNFIAVVHIDGNAMGKRVENMQKKYSGSWEGYRGKAKEFSREIDSQFKEAYLEMAKYVAGNVTSGRLHGLDIRKHKENNKDNLPVRRIITAGDDICFVAEGRIGLECAAAFIRALGRKVNPVDKENYSACAGVAIVHQKYPFYKAYELAEKLCSNAKKFGAGLSDDGSGKDVSAIDWHIEFGEMKDSLEEIREVYRDASGNGLIQRPYIISAADKLLDKEPIRQYVNFRNVITDIQRKENYARGHLKELRTVLRQGEKETEYFLKFHKIEGLFREDLKGDFTLLFDAVELMDTFIALEGSGSGEN